MIEAFIDILLWWLHVIVILFNLLGWIWQKTRRAHLIVLSFTLFSWLVLGLHFGLGYCFLTDWHWQVKLAMGERDLPHSFIAYLLNNQMQMGVSIRIVDTLTVLGMTLSTALSIYINRDLFKSKQ
uniref:DUF2784 domain-containing protein n=1 Tax=Ningiella ruwaisensis TaxID=2364274 RepID=UPI0019D5462A|nr:DUF2784 domain-containing protein [Ningiella ruwaisensis]